MRRIDVIAIGVGLLGGGGLVFAILRGFGLDATSAGIWTQAVLVGGLVLWLLTYLFRATTGGMTYYQQRQNYEDAVFQKRLEEMSPDEVAALQAELEAEPRADAPEEPNG